MQTHDTRTGEAVRLAAADRPANLVDLVQRSVRRHPDRIALKWKPRGLAEKGVKLDENGWATLTYDELWSWVEQISLGLVALGVDRGDRVVILSRSRPEWVAADLASLALGAVTCPIFSAEKPDKVEFMLRNVRARFIFADSAQQVAKLATIGAPDDGTDAPRVIVFDPSEATAGTGSVSLEQVMAMADQTPQTRSSWGDTIATIGREDVATIVHTSGTSGEPKGVVLTHGNVIHNYEAARQALPVSQDDLALSVLPLSHMLERAAGMYVPLGIGAAVAFAEPVMERWASNLGEVRPTIMVTVPLFFQRIHQRVLAEIERQATWKQRLFRWGVGLGAMHYANHLAGRGDGVLLRLQLAVARRIVFARIRARTGGRLRFFCSGGAPLPRETGEFFSAMGMLILEGYGLSETAPLLAINRAESFRFGTVGPPAAETEIRIDPASGEILARGPQVMRGYLDDPAATAAAIDADGWFHTGDIGQFDEAGRLSITDRIKNLIVLDNGKKVSPTPMEIALVASSYIAEAVIIGDGHAATGALVVPDFDRVRSSASAASKSPEALSRDADVISLVEREARRLLRSFAAYERPRHVALLPRELSEEHGEVVGPLRKPKRGVIAANWPEQVDRLFAGGTALAGESE